LTDGLQMIANAREDSLAAAKLYESLMQIVGRYQDTQHPVEENVIRSGNCTTVETPPVLPSEILREGQPSSQINEVIQLDLIEWDDLFSSVSSSPCF
jgi:hypothetical protein